MTVHEFLAQELKEQIISRLSGSSDSTKRMILQYPSKQIIVGMLTDRELEHLGKTISKNNSLSASFLCSSSRSLRLEILPKFSIYYRVKPQFSEIRSSMDIEEGRDSVETPKVWKRYDFEGKSQQFNLETETSTKKEPIDISGLAEHVNADNQVFRGGSKIPVDVLRKKEDYEGWIEKQRTLDPETSWVCELMVERRPFSRDDRKLDIITVFLMNQTTWDGKKAFEPSMFNCSLQIDILSGKLEPFVYDYEFEGFPERTTSYVRAMNCQAEYDEELHRISTKGYAESHQFKIVPKNEFHHNGNEIRTRFEDLGHRERAVKILKMMKDSMEHNLNDYSGSYKKDNKKYKHLVDLFSSNTNRFEVGVETLLSNDDAMKAFNLMNATFQEASKFDSWRLFQIQFIVSCIPDLLDLDTGTKVVDVLHIATGGGKSEAYFGLVVFSAFYDRMVGREFGVTAITKFPLRMLSVQQLQRISRIFAYAERLRQREKIDGQPFSVGYFVGSSEESPRRSTDLAEKLKKGNELPGRIFSKCPFDECGGDVTLSISKANRGIIHICKSCGSVFPFYFTDEEVYRFIPTFIVSTVDKHAGFAQQRRYRNLIGGSLCSCEHGHGFVPRGDICEVETIEGGKPTRCGSHGVESKHGFSTSPRLIIQDEMHLIKEGFGTIDSHFETAIEHTARSFSGHGFKNIAMTATISGAKHQIMELYGKEMRIVPGQSPEGYGNKDFFFEISVNDKSKPELQRIHVGLKPNNRDNQFACLLTLRHLADVLLHIKQNLDDYSSCSGYSKTALENALDDYVCLLTYHNKKQDVHSMSYFLNAVVNSKLDELKVKRRVLTGEKDLDYIKETIDIVESHSAKDEKALHATFATSVVSHGVDIDRWNFMLFQGIPRSTSEYIQAFSRTGRKKTGIVFVWFYPTRTRDISVFRSFGEYHSVLEHKVEHVPISRFAPLGLDQTLTSIFSGSVLNYLSETQGRPLYNTKVVLEDVVKDSSQRSAVVDFLKEAYLTDLGLKGHKDYKTRIPSMVEERLNFIDRYLRTGGKEIYFFPNALKDSPHQYYRTQFGMRGIQDEVTLEPEQEHNGVFTAFKRRD